MAKLCPAGKAAAKRKFKVYPSAYANIWASKYCKGKVGRTKKANGGSAMAKNVPSKFKGFSKLPEGVQNKISPSLAKKYESGGRVVSGVMGRGQGKVIKHKKTQII